MFEIGILEEFEAILSLKGDFGPSTRLHGHTYKVKAVVEGDRLDEAGTLYDISQLKESLKQILSYLHYQNLNELEAFRDVNPTAENVCKYIYQRLAPVIRDDRIQGLEVTVWESPTAFASYRERFSG
jgi:6-pyruvoyltetrahydropterin/6-carboxytetrahydropterin synthase